MSGISLYDYSLEMLRSTNVYERPIESLRFRKNRKECSLLKILQEHSHGRTIDLRTSIRTRNETAFICITETLEEYLGSYPAAYPVKQRYRESFRLWLDRIASKYDIADLTYTEIFSSNVGNTAIAMLQMLQDPKGITKDEMAKKLKISERAVLKNLCKLDHSLGESEQTRETMYIGGQPIQAQIRSFRRPGETIKRYRTINTIHPIVLQENIMQVGTLIQSLARNYAEYNNDTSYIVGLEIWSQISEFGKNRIREVFAPGDQNLKVFIEYLDDECPSEKAAGFYSEREMQEESGFTDLEETLIYYIKSPDRRCNLQLSLQDGLSILQDVQIVFDREDEAGKNHYKIVRKGKDDVFFTRDQVIKIE